MKVVKQEKGMKIEFDELKVGDVLCCDGNYFLKLNPVSEKELNNKNLFLRDYETSTGHVIYLNW